MNTDKIINELTIIYENLQKSELEDSEIRIGGILRELKNDLIDQSAKKSGRGGQFKAFERIIKNVPGHRIESCGGVIQTKSGARAVCDGYCAVRIFKSDVIMPDKKVEEQNAPDIDRIFNASAGESPADLPNVGELRGLIRTATASYTGKNKKSLCQLFKLTGKNGVDVYVNAKYLLNVLEALPDATCEIGKSRLSTILFEAEDGDGVLVPVRYDGTRKNFQVVNEQKI